VKSFVKFLTHDETLKKCVSLVAKVHAHIVLWLNSKNSVSTLCLMKNSNTVILKL
jgi:hypothetical protein